MKKLSILFVLSLLVLTGCGSTAENEVVDAYTSASTTKEMLSGDALSAAKEALANIDSDLATLAKTQEAGYKAPENEKHVQIMSINPDGTPGVSTIHAWQINGDEVKVVVTDGQSAQNIAKEGARCTILAHDEVYYQIHLEVTEVVKLEYSDENYNNGLFNSSYSGKNNQLAEYTITMKVLSVEQVNLYVPN